MQQVILHIPHSSTCFPSMEGFINSSLVTQEMNLLTDWYTDELFSAQGVPKIVTPWSRLFCDVERFRDNRIEPMARYGRGALYIKAHSGEPLRKISKDTKSRILKKYYVAHHLKLKMLVSKSLKANRSVTIVDCHSFPAVPYLPEIPNPDSFPDFCIGTDSFHTPVELTLKTKMFLEENGYTVWIDKPYSGCMVPTNYYKKEKRVKSIMIEVNRNLYLSNNPIEAPIKSAEFAQIKRILQQLIKSFGNEK